MASTSSWVGASGNSSGGGAQQRLSRLSSHLTASASEEPRRKLRRAVVVDGCRTPFVRSFGQLMEFDSIALGVEAVRGLLLKTKLEPKLVEDVIWGNVVTKSSAPNVAREIVIDLGLPGTIPGVTVSRACLSGLQAIEQGIALIESGQVDIVIAGGSDSTSNGELPMPAKLTRALGKYALGGGKKKGWSGVRELLEYAGPPTQWLPKQNEIAERSTGKTMGYHADLMAEINNISREEQDRFSISSHAKASKASHKLEQEIVPVETNEGTVSRDDMIRDDIVPSKLASLKPAFRSAEEAGTITAASSSALTDGASAVLLMSESKARELDFPTDISFRSYYTTAVDPVPQLLIAPAVALPRALQRAGVSLEDIDFFEIHEAFAAQVLSTLRALESSEFCSQYAGLSSPVGSIPLHKINPNGGSIAIGHPFAATGGRLVLSAVNELRRSGQHLALLSICAAGGLGGVAILQRRDQ